MAAHALDLMMYGYTLLVPMNQRVLYKLSKEHKQILISDPWHTECSNLTEGTLFSWLHVNYAHLASVKSEHSVCHESFMTIYIMLLPYLVEHSLVHWYQQCLTVHHVPKCMSCHKAIVVIAGTAHCFHDYMYITPILLLFVGSNPTQANFL